MLLILGIASTLPRSPLAFAQTETQGAAALATISTHLQAQLITGGRVDFLVVLREQVDATTAAATVQSAAVGVSLRHAKATAIYAQLTATAQRTQSPLRAWLDAQGIAYRPFYLVNMIEVQA
ncbi:MAG: hypothetical protein M3Q45_00240, partial [Chloroflexota bacterium]|nr:hypothetical protein [Chloroflexota bacterium]